MAKTLPSPKSRRARAEYERLNGTLDILSDPDMMRQIRQSEADFAAGEKGLSFEEVFGEPLIPRRRRKRR